MLQADELDGEIDLRSCTDVTEYAVQRNYGFQIHVRLRATWGWWWAAWLEAPEGGFGIEHGSPWRLDPYHSFTQRLCPQSQTEL